MATKRDDYLWDRSGTADPAIKQLEELLAPLAHDEPLDDLRLLDDRRRTPVVATAREPVSKGTRMNILAKRILAPASLVASASLLGITLYVRHSEAPPPTPAPHVALEPIAAPPALAHTPHAAAIDPTTSADLAITAGESAWIHAPNGEVDIEIQSACNAEVELSVGTNEARGKDEIVAELEGTHSPDGRISTYHLASGVRIELETYRYTSRCVGRSPNEGVIALDRDDAHGPIGSRTNARVFSDADKMITVSHGIHMFGTVMPGARVAVGARPVALDPVDPLGGDPLIDSAFSTTVPISLDHLGGVIRVDDANGIHFYASRASQVLVDACGNFDQPKQQAAELAARGNDADALDLLNVAMATCTPDRNLRALALTYACKAGDLGAARTYWRTLPPELQQQLAPACAQHAISRDQLDK